MHMSDALVSPAVAAAAGAASLALLCVAVRRTGRSAAARGDEPHIVPLMGVMGAFVFAAQMVNFAIPGTGSSGHLVGGILLAAMLGPWAAFATLASVLVLQCLLFADGGLLALGCNILNMAALSCLAAYPLVFRPLVSRSATNGRIAAASVAASVAALVLGAAAVTLETEASGITALPAGRFLLFMLPIHLLIGLCEGAATAALLCTVKRHRPRLRADLRRDEPQGRARIGTTIAAIAAAALLIGGVCARFASDAPDGLEWSIERTAGDRALRPATDGAHRRAAEMQTHTALMPGYETSLAGIVGSGAIVATAFGITCLVRPRRKRS